MLIYIEDWSTIHYTDVYSHAENWSTYVAKVSDVMIMMLRNTVEVYGTVPAVGISYWFRKWGRGISIVDIVLRASH